MGIFKENPVCRLCIEEEETTFHVVFECEFLARKPRGENLQEEPGEKAIRPD
jgi:hypothetical protein